MKKIKIKLSRVETVLVKSLLEEAGNGQHDMGCFLENVILLEMAQKVLPKLIFVSEASFSLCHSEADVLASILYDPHDPASMGSTIARGIDKQLVNMKALMSNYNMRIE